jgi:prostaglandin-E synthase
MSSRHPEILWAQRSDKVFLTVELPDAKNAQVKLEPDGRFTFTATCKDAMYETELQLYGAVKVETSKINEGRRHTFCVFEKAEKAWWERLLKKEGKAPPFVKADWNHWIDEDEEDEAVKTADLNMTRAMDDYPDMEHTPDSDDEEDYDDAPDVSKAEV